MNSYAEDDPIVTEIKSKLQRDICDIWAWLDTIYPGALFIVGISWHHSSGREYIARVAPVTFSTEYRLQLKASFEEGLTAFGWPGLQFVCPRSRSLTIFREFPSAHEKMSRLRRVRIALERRNSRTMQEPST